ncbi:MAG TPA: BMP family protein [Nitrososphaera sp.]
MRKRMLTYVATAGIAIVSLVLVVLTFPPINVQPGNSADQNSTLRVAVVTDALFNDQGWGESSLNAAQFIETHYGIAVAKEDNIGIADIESSLSKYAREDYDLIIAHGFQWGDPAVRVGKQFPEVKIVVFTGLAESGNVASIFPQQQQGSFLLGALAGMMTKTNVIGYVGGEEYPNLINIFGGFEQGAKEVNPDVVIIGRYLNDWDNTAKGKEAATSIIRQGADVIFHVADSSGHGVIRAAEENQIYALGAVQDQNELAPSTVLSSFVLDVDKAYDKAISMTVDGTFEGRILKPGIEPEKGAPGDGEVYLAPFHDLGSKVPASTKARLEDLTQKILDGELLVPERLELESPS